MRKLFAKSEDERTRALEEINVLKRQKDKMYSSSIKRIVLLEKYNDSTIDAETARINSLNEAVSALIYENK